MNFFVDYGRSFIQTKGPKNAVRFLIESRMEVLQALSKNPIMFYQVASCKSENTFAERHLFMSPNYNFLPVFVDGNKIIIYRSYVPWREEYISVADEKSSTWEIWGKPELLIRKYSNVVLLETTEEIIDATHAGLPIIGRTEIKDEESGMVATIEYPVKTMNTNVEKNCYQVDTGPVLFPHFEKGIENLKEFVSIAYIAFNTRYFADFVIEKLTMMGEKLAIPHFSGIIENVNCTNLLYAEKE